MFITTAKCHDKRPTQNRSMRDFEFPPSLPDCLRAPQRCADAPGRWAGGPGRPRPLRCPARLTASASASSGLSLARPGPLLCEDPAPPPRRGSPSPGEPLHRLSGPSLNDAALRGPRERRREDSGRDRPRRSFHQVSGRGRLWARGKCGGLGPATVFRPPGHRDLRPAIPLMFVRIH